MRRLCCVILFFLAGLPALAAQTGKPPKGFKRIFNGKNLKGWHVSEVNHHGNSKGWTVENGILFARQDRPGNGGILLTDRKYRNFEVYLELNPDFGCDGGLFLRSNEKGEAYQVMIDYLEGGSVGGIYGEGLPDVAKTRGTGSKRAENWQQTWKKGAWNTLRARIEGDVPHIQVWINEIKVTDWTDEVNHSIGGATEGMIALQMHMSNERTRRWKVGGAHRFRVVAVKELP